MKYTNEYIEGTAITIGLWLPYNGNIYGILALSYLSGKRYKTCQTNAVILTSSSITNSAWGTYLQSNQSTDIK